MKKLMGGLVAIMAIGATAQATPVTLWSSSSLFGHGEAAIESVPPGITLQPLVTITSDRDASASQLSAMVDRSGDMTGLFSAEMSGTSAGDKVFALTQIESKDGAVLLESSGRKALILQGSLDDKTQEGKFRLNYLTNGLFMKYSSCDFYIRKNGNARYIQNAYNGAKVTSVKIVTHSLGITTVQGLCP